MVAKFILKLPDWRCCLDFHVCNWPHFQKLFQNRFRIRFFLHNPNGACTQHSDFLQLPAVAGFNSVKVQEKLIRIIAFALHIFFVCLLFIERLKFSSFPIKKHKQFQNP